MVKKIPENHSIAKTLQEETYVVDTAIQDYQEDVRLAEKERLQTNQKRGQLLQSLRDSMKQAGRATNVLEGMQQEFTRIIQEGSPQEIEQTIKQYQKQISSLQSKALVSSKTGTVIRQFFDRAKVFLEKKRMLAKVENTINSFVVTDLGKTNADSTLTKLTQITSSIRSDLLSLTDTIIDQIEMMEDQILIEMNEEEKKRSLFYACLSSFDDQKKGKLILLCQKKIQGSSFENRLHFFKTLVEQLAKTDTRAARKVHSHIRKAARSLLREGQYKKAVSELCYALHLWKDDVYTYRLLADVFFRLQEEKNAYVALGEVLRLCPEDDRLRRRMAEYWVKKKSLPKAIHEYQILLEHLPGNLSFRRELGRILYDNKSFNQVPEVLLAYVQTMPEDRECLTYIGNSYIHLKEWEHAILYLQRSIALNSSQPETFQVLSIAYRKLELYEQAIQILKAGIKFNPDSLLLKILLGTLFLECEMWDRVLAVLQPVFDVHPDSPVLLKTMGQAHLSLGHIDEALSLLTQANKYKQDDPATFVVLAQAYRKKGDSTNTVLFYEKAIQFNQNETSLLQELAGYYAECGQWQQATETLKKTKKE